LLAGYANERRVIELTASYLPNLDQKTTQELKARLDAMPPFGAPGAALMITEKKSLEWFIRKVKETKGKDDLLEFLSWINISEEPSKKSAPRAPKFVEECGGTAAGVVQFAEKVLPHFDATAKMFDLPLDQFDKALQRQSAEMADNPVYKLFFPAIINVRQAKARADVRQAEFLAAIAVRLEGQGALKTRLDPVTNEPFEYVAVPGGFELRSTVKGQDDAPITLTVGRRGSSSSRPVNR